MNDRKVDQWLQARVDGALDPADARRLDEALATSEAARMKAAEIETIDRLLTELGAVDPPRELKQSVLARIEHRKQVETNRNVNSGRPAYVAGGGVIMGRKVMWGLAAAAAVVFAIFAVRGYPSVGSGTEATVNPAQRAQATQLASNDVVLGDADAQAFLQSDVFDRLIKD